MRCRNCGKSIDVKICPYCSCDNRRKSRLTAGLLQLLCGSVGLGRFYLGYNKIALLQLVSSICSCGIAGAVWGFIDGLMILSGSLTSDAKDNLLSE